MESLELEFIDTHCHVYSPEFDHDRSDMVKRAFDAGVSQMMLPNIDAGSIEPMMALALEFPGQCMPMMGLHPCSVKEDYRAIIDSMGELLLQYNFLGIGETGVDLYWDVTYKDLQIDAFEQHIEWGKELNLPVIIHSRESLDLNIEIINQHKDEKLKGIFHCFSGDYEQAIRIYEMGFKIGIGGVITYKNSDLWTLLPRLPKEMIVLETDSPYLAPVPFRGKRNEPSYILIIAQKVAESLNQPITEVAYQTTLNALDVFGKKE